MSGGGAQYLRVGVIGCGMAGQRHIAGLLAVPGVEVAWLCDTQRARLDECSRRHGISPITSEYSEVLCDPGVDAVVLSTPPRDHADMALAAIAAGKHVLVEKPLATTADDADRIVAAARAAPRLLVMDGSARHARLHRKFHRIAELIAGGAIGDVYSVHHRAVYRRRRAGVEYHPEARWFTVRSVAGGGPLLDHGVYDLAFHFGVLGMYPSVRELISLTRGRLDDISTAMEGFDVEEHGIVMMKLDGEIVYYWERASNAHAAEENTTRIVGTSGSLTVSYPSWHHGVIEVFDGTTNRITRIDVGPGGEEEATADNRQLDAHFVDCLRGIRMPVVPLDEAAAIVRLIMAAYARAASGCADSAVGVSVRARHEGAG